jgi:hypothetical protein
MKKLAAKSAGQVAAVYATVQVDGFKKLQGAGGAADPHTHVATTPGMPCRVLLTGIFHLFAKVSTTPRATVRYLVAMTPQPR